MTNMFGGVERPGPWETTGDHERRIRALEALENCCDGDFCDSTGAGYDAVIESLSPFGFWKLDESSGSVAADSSGNGLDLTVDPGYVDPLWGSPPGPPGTQTADFENGTGGVGGTAARVSRTWEPLTDPFTAVIFVNLNSLDGTQIFGQGTPDRASGKGWMLAVTSSGTLPANLPYIHCVGDIIYADSPVVASTWMMLAAVYDGTDFTLNVNGVNQSDEMTGTYTPVVADSPLWIGHDGFSGVQLPQFVGSYAFLIPEALSEEDLLSVYQAEENVPSGYVQLADGEGGCEWGPVPGCDSGGTPLDEEILANPCLEAFWKLNETSGDVAADSKNGYDMDSGAGVPPDWATETTPYGELSAEFNGQTSGELLEATSFPALTGDLAIEIWARRDESGGGHAMLNQGDPWPANGTGVGLGWLGSGSGYAAIGSVGDGSGGPHNIVQSGFTPDGDWHHFVLTRESNVWTFYIDAVVIGTYDDGGTNYSTDTGMQIGNIAGSLVADNFDGNLSYGAAYSCALSAEDVADHYAAGVNAGNVSAGEVQMADGEGGCEWGCPQVDSTESVGECWGVHSLDGTTPAPDGYVLTADGSGGSYWAYPTMEVLEDGV